MVPAAKVGGSWRSWELSPAAALLGHGDRKQQVRVAALRLCVQRKRSWGWGFPWGLGVGRDGKGGQGVTLLQRATVTFASSKLKVFRLWVAEGMGSPVPALSCLEGLAGTGPAHGVSRQAEDSPGLVGSVAHNLQSACASGISSVKKVPAVAWDAAEGLILFTPRRLSKAMETVDALGGTLVSAPKHLLGTLYSYVPVSLSPARSHPSPTNPTLPSLLP